MKEHLSSDQLHDFGSIFLIFLDLCVALLVWEEPLYLIILTKVFVLMKC